MSGIPSEYSIIGEVLAIALAIILLSGIALYVAFRVKETFHEERGRGARVAKVALLIGLLFLSGGVFYFFAAGFNSSGSGTSSTLSSTVTNSSHSSTSSSHSSTSSTSSTRSSSGTSTSVSSTVSSSKTSSKTTSSSSSSILGGLSLTTSFPSTETKGSSFDGTFTIVNNASVAAGSATLQLMNLLKQFDLQSCSMSVNGGEVQDCSPSVSEDLLTLGNIAPGTTIITLKLAAPSQPGQFMDMVMLHYQLGTPRTLTATINVHVKG
jgi:hypothetical protein